jgi:TolB-like protein
LSGISHALFLSYASQDAEAAQKICEALRARGIEVFLDQSELRGGDAWDKKIRREIHDCVLFIPIVSQHTQERLEGYFRHEWKLAIERTHHMAEQKAFLVPVVIDGSSDQEAFVPDEFREVQWTRLPAGETPPEFVTRIQKLLSGESRPLPMMARRAAAVTSRRSSLLKHAVLAVVLAAVAAYLLVEKPWLAKSPAREAFAPPAHSIAVLPFVNLNGDKEQQYFSDGLTEEVLNSLTAIDGLQVAARTSSFSFREHADIGTVANKLNVGSVLEGSVRRSGNSIRVTAQLINAVTGFHLWSKTYDEESGDVLKLQTEIATAVANALKITLTGDDLAAKIALGETANLAAFDAYLRGTEAAARGWARSDDKEIQGAIALYTQALRVDPNFALAFARRSEAYSNLAGDSATGPAARVLYDKALADARQAIALAPELSPGHSALAGYFEQSEFDFAQADEEYQRAQSLARRSCGACATFAVLMGHTERGLAELQRAAVVDPLNAGSYAELSLGLYFSRRYVEAVDAAMHAINLDSAGVDPYATRGLAYYGLGDFEHARTSCGAKPDYWRNQQCLAITYDKLGRHTEAQALLSKYRAAVGDNAAYQYTEIYAQWGDVPKALEWLDTAMRVRDPGLEYLKTDPLLDPLRKEPRFQAIERELKFPT